MESNQEIQNQVEFLYHETAKQLYKLALYTLGNRKVAEQITVNAFCEAFNTISDKTDVNLFKERSIKLLYKHGRKIQKKSEWNGCTIPVRTSEDIVEQAGVKKKELIQMLGSLNFDERYILLLYYCQEFSIQQIAKAICLPVFLAKKRFGVTVNKAVKYMKTFALL